MVHTLDWLAGLALRARRPGSVIFPDGWGDDDGGETGVDPDPAEVLWQPKVEHRGFRRRRGTFPSPVADRLPTECREVHVELTIPSAGTDRVVVLLPSWNDESPERRRLFALAFARAGIATAAMEIPFYGRRRREGTTGMPVRTVADFVVMGRGAVAEATALLSACRREYPRVGVAGFSMGASLAAFASARLGPGLAVGLMAPSYSPAPIYLDGVLRHAIDWTALGGKEARVRLAAVLDEMSVLTLAPLPHHRHAVLVAGSADGFVPPAATAALAEHWDGSELRWLTDGHASLWRRHRGALVDAVADSFTRLSGDPPATGPG